MGLTKIQYNNAVSRARKVVPRIKIKIDHSPTQILNHHMEAAYSSSDDTIYIRECKQYRSVVRLQRILYHEIAHSFCTKGRAGKINYFNNSKLVAFKIKNHSSVSLNYHLEEIIVDLVSLKVCQAMKLKYFSRKSNDRYISFHYKILRNLTISSEKEEQKMKDYIRKKANKILKILQNRIEHSNI